MRRSTMLFAMLPLLVAATAAQAQTDPSGVPSAGYTAQGAVRSGGSYGAAPYGNPYAAGPMGMLAPQVPGAVTLLPGGAIQYQTPYAVSPYGMQRAPDNSTTGRINSMFDPTQAMQSGAPAVMQPQQMPNGMAGNAPMNAPGNSAGPGAAVAGGTTTGTTPGGAAAALPAVPGAAQPPAAEAPRAAAGMPAGETFSGRLQLSSNGMILVGDRQVSLDGAVFPATDELCGGGFMVRCGRAAAAVAEGLFSRVSLARCSVVTAQTNADEPIHAACQASRQEVAALLVQAGAARAEGTRLAAYQAEAQADGRGLWAGSTAAMPVRGAGR